MAGKLQSVSERLERYSFPEPNSGCVLWMGFIHRRSGYGMMGAKIDGKKFNYAHKVAYELVKGSVPKGLELDHLCRIRCCVNPDHLEPVTRRENIMRGLAPIVNGSDHRAKTHCKHGHPYDEANTYWDARGHRSCRACHRQWTMECANRKLGVG